MLNKLAKFVMPKAIQTKGLVSNYSPELYLIGGMAAGIAAVVMIAKAHKRSEEVFAEDLEDLETEIELLDGSDGYEVIDEEGDLIDHEVTVQERVKALAPIYVDIAAKGVKLYGPGILMGVGSLALLLGSHGALKGRNRALLATVGLLQQGFSEYRKRVVNEYGVEADERLYFGAETQNVTHVIVDENGKKKKRKSKENRIPDKFSPIMYSRLFDETNHCWKADRDLNEFWLSMVERQMNDQLEYKGVLMLNTVYEALGFEPTTPGQIVGWSLRVPGDDFVSFGLDSSMNSNRGDNRYVLDFNVNGPVFEELGTGEIPPIPEFYEDRE